MNAMPYTEATNWLNARVLKWAREWRGRTVEEAAKRVGKKPQHIVDWEDGVASPTVKQARVLAHFYDRAFVEFFLPNPPELSSPTTIPDFRMHKSTEVPRDDWTLQNIQLWAETQRTNALDLYEEIGERPPILPNQLFASLGSPPEKYASRTRELLGFQIQDQIAMARRESGALPNILRQRLESVGVLTLRRSELTHLHVRGICIAVFPLPAIVFSNEAPTAQAFTIVHEFAHVLLRESGVTGYRSRDYEQQPVERWCDRFAASFLMPDEQITALLGAMPSRPSSAIDDEDLRRIADIFRVSPHAMLIRLVHLGYVKANYYWEVKRPEFDQQESQYRSFGRASYYGSRFRSSLGDLYTGLVLEAWSTGRITNHTAAEFMGIKNLAHLDDIRDRFAVS